LETQELHEEYDVVYMQWLKALRDENKTEEEKSRNLLIKANKTDVELEGLP